MDLNSNLMNHPPYTREEAEEMSEKQCVCGTKSCSHKQAFIRGRMSLADKCREMEAKIEKLQAFKDYVHKRLDDAGVEKEPSGEHSEHGCRIGDRLDIVLVGRKEMQGLISDMSFHLANTTQLVARTIDMEYNERIGHYDNYKKAESEIKAILDRSNKLVEKAKALNHKDKQP